VKRIMIAAVLGLSLFSGYAQSVEAKEAGGKYAEYCAPEVKKGMTILEAIKKDRGMKGTEERARCKRAKEGSARGK
jgi:hypothetical protein